MLDLNVSFARWKNKQNIYFKDRKYCCLLVLILIFFYFRYYIKLIGNILKRVFSIRKRRNKKMDREEWVSQKHTKKRC